MRYIKTMLLNRYDPQEVDAYLKEFAPENERLAELLCIALKNPIMKEERYWFKMPFLPDDAPEWAREKWGKPDQKFVSFLPQKVKVLKGQVRSIAAWIDATLKEHATQPSAKTAWLDDVDEYGRPKKLVKIATVEEAYRLVDEAMNEKPQEEDETIFEAVKEDVTVELVKTFEKNRYCIVRLKSVKALRIEGNLMGHCLRDGDYDDAIEEDVVDFYSLRDAKNEPHVTFEVDREEKILRQCKGKGDKKPHTKYMPYVHQFIQENELSVNSVFFYVDLIKVGEEYLALSNLPDHFVIEDDLELADHSLDIENIFGSHRITIKGGIYFFSSAFDKINLNNIKAKKYFVCEDGRKETCFQFDTEKDLKAFWDKVSDRKMQIDDVLLNGKLYDKKWPRTIEVQKLTYQWNDKDEWPHDFDRPSRICVARGTSVIRSILGNRLIESGDDYEMPVDIYYEMAGEGKGCLGGSLHRMNGPAHLFIDRKGNVLFEEWARNKKDYYPSLEERALWEKRRPQEVRTIMAHLAERLPWYKPIPGR